MIKPSINFCLLKNCPIFQLLQIEEALLRTNKENWCIINLGTPDAIVMSSSAKKEDWLYPTAQHSQKLPIIRRFSGGGTVYVDKSTFFVTFIIEQKNHTFYPSDILKWSKEFYKKAFSIPHFNLSENDFTLNGKKVAGNAHYLRKDRWFQHSSFLYDYSINNMEAHLPIPKKIPKHRTNRSHKDFLTRLSHYLTTDQFTTGIVNQLKNLYTVSTVNQDQFKSRSFDVHRKSTRIFTS